MRMPHDEHVRCYWRNVGDPLDQLSNVLDPRYEGERELTFRELQEFCARDIYDWDRQLTGRERERHQKILDPHYVKLKPFEGNRDRTATRRWRG